MKKMLVLIATIGLATAVPAQASPNARASCVGLIVSDHARWGDLKQVRQMLRGVATQLDVPYGALISSAAQRHDGSHAVCGNE